jgi:monoamine oxidase
VSTPGGHRYEVGQNAAFWESIPEEEAMRKLHERLRRQFGDDVPAPIALHRTQHGSDELSLGAYTATKVGVTMQQLADMVAPLRYGNNASVVFGGEHTCAAFQGFAHGAYTSGKRAAAIVLRSLGMPAAAAAVYHGECGDHRLTARR